MMQATPAKERVKRWTNKDLRLFEDAVIALGEGRAQEAKDQVRIFQLSGNNSFHFAE